MKPFSLVWVAGLVATLGFSGPVMAQNLDAAWLAGKWQGDVQIPRVPPIPVRILVKADGTFEGEAQDPRFGLSPLLDGKWEIAGDTVKFDYRIDLQTRNGRMTSQPRWTLKRDGEDLVGTGLNPATSAQWDMALRRAK